MAQQELDLLQLTAAAVAQFRTGATQVVRSNLLYSRPFAASLHHIPGHVLRDPLPHTFPALPTARKILPCVIPAYAAHSSSATLTQAGIGTVRVCRGQTAGFQVHTVTHDLDAIERQARFRAVPGDELVDGVLINPA
jgi:hypothetical protein